MSRGSDKNKYFVSVVGAVGGEFLERVTYIYWRSYH
nr:unnamed protein product [Callosobruchus analis]